MQIIPANDIKTRGVPAFEKALAKDGEALITVRGEARYVVLTMREYDRLHELELEAAVAETRRDLAAGRTRKESVRAHVKRIRG
jgi:PHD/YefM family antitoxin component YafN of YafNO toxin-antitoxin module